MKYLSVYRIWLFFFAQSYRNLWIAAGVLFVVLLWLALWPGGRMRAWKKLLWILVLAALVVGMVLGIPKWKWYNATSIHVPKYYSKQEKQQFEERRQEALQNRASWGRGNSGLYNNIGIIRSAYKDYDGAVKSFRQAASADPNDPRFWRNLGITYTYQDKFLDAEKAFLQAFKLAPTAPEHWLELGELYQFKLKDAGKARSFYLEVLARSNNSIAVAQAFANFLENGEKDYQEAVKYWQVVADGLDEHQKDPFVQHIRELKASYNLK